jgi:hypothetical protein
VRCRNGVSEILRQCLSDPPGMEIDANVVNMADKKKGLVK